MTVKVGDTLDFTIGGKATGLPTPVAASDAAIKSYVDAQINGVEWKAPVEAMATTNINTATQGLGAIDGFTPVANDRILLTGQTTQAQNGIWLAQTGAWTRPNDFATGSVQINAAVFVQQGTANGGKGEVIAGTADVTVDTTAHTWVQFNAGVTYTGGTGITVSGSTISLTTLNGKAAGTITGNGSLTSFTLTHTLGTTDVVVMVMDSSGNQIVCGVQATNTTTVTLTFATAPANTIPYRVVAIG